MTERVVHSLIRYPLSRVMRRTIPRSGGISLRKLREQGSQ